MKKTNNFYFLSHNYYKDICTHKEVSIFWPRYQGRKLQYFSNNSRSEYFSNNSRSEIFGKKRTRGRDRYLELKICRIVTIVHHQSFSDQLNKDQKSPWWQQTFLEKTARKEEEMYSSSIKYTTTYPFHTCCIKIQTALDKVSQVQILFKTFPFDWLPRPECSSKLKSWPFKSSQISQHVIFSLVQY